MKSVYRDLIKTKALFKLADCLKELMETTYDISISYFQPISVSSPR